MEPERRRQLLLAALAIVLTFVAYRVWPRTSATPAVTSNNQTRPAAPAAAATSGTTARAASPQGGPDVHLEALDAERPRPGPADRNLFRFKPKAPPPPPPAPLRPTADTPITGPVTPPPPPAPPPPPPITLKFIGVIDEGAGKPKIAVLSDGIGPPVSAREGATVLGRYRILKIGVESIEMAYLDGRGRQTIRLSGS